MDLRATDWLNTVGNRAPWRLRTRQVSRARCCARIFNLCFKGEQLSVAVLQLAVCQPRL